MNILNRSKIAFCIFFAVNIISTQLFTAQRQNYALAQNQNLNYALAQEPCEEKQQTIYNLRSESQPLFTILETEQEKKELMQRVEESKKFHDDLQKKILRQKELFQQNYSFVNDQTKVKNDQTRFINSLKVFAVAGTITVISIVTGLTLTNKPKTDHDVLWNLLPEAFRRVQMCEKVGCSSRVQIDAQKIIKQCNKIDTKKTSDILLNLSQDSFAFIPREDKLTCLTTYTEVSNIEKHFDELSLEKMLNLQRNKK